MTKEEIDEFDKAIVDALDMININAIRKFKKRIALKRFKEASGNTDESVF